MTDQRRANENWTIYQEGGKAGWAGWWYSAVQLAVLMDLRDELQQLNRLLACPNFTGIPQTLREIKRNTTKRRNVRRK